jgi:hypothetical protein
MSDLSCDREQEVVSALRRGAFGSELLRHTTTCAVCADVVAVSEFLREEARLANQSPLPDASFIWRKAQLRARREAVESATRPIRVFTNLAYVAGAVAALWLVIGVAGLPAWISGLRDYRAPAMHLSNGYLFGMTLLGGAVTLLGACFGSSYLLLSNEIRK